MAAAGQAFENLLTGERMVFGKTARDSNGLLLEIEFFSPLLCTGSDRGKAS